VGVRQKREGAAAARACGCEPGKKKITQGKCDQTVGVNKRIALFIYLLMEMQNIGKQSWHVVAKIKLMKDAKRIGLI
jgi:hypothetical protein